MIGLPNDTLYWQLGNQRGSVRAIAGTSLILEGAELEQLFRAAGASPREATLVLTEGEETWSLQGRVHEQGTLERVAFVVSAPESRATLARYLGRLRKQQHIDLCRDQDVETQEKSYGFAELAFVPQAAPELDWHDLDIRARVLGKTFAAPLFISGMTGGIAQGETINRRLAAAAAAVGIPMGLGSQRVACEHGHHAGIFTMKKQHPELTLFGNLGCAQLVQPGGIALAEKAVAMVAADALVIHLNVVQECLQVEGAKEFKGLLKRLEELVSRISVPVIVKEVGGGISVSCAESLFATGIAALDIAGKGGTSWGYIEGLRSADPRHQSLGQSFRNWGIPTAYSLVAVKTRFPEATIFASGGIRDGITVAKALGLGASLVGLALPLFQAALVSEEAVVAALEQIITGLKITMVASGCQNTAELNDALCYGQPLQEEFRAHFQKRGKER